jgi:Glycosyl transferase family 2
VSGSVPELVFNFADGQDACLVEPAAAVCTELAAQGIRARIAVGEYPEPRPGRVFVLMAPHEYISQSGFRPPAEMLERCIGISAEQPTNASFSESLELAREFGAAFDVNPFVARRYRAGGAEAEVLELGHCRTWDRFENGSRDIDVLFIGRLTAKRGKALAGYAGPFERYRCHIQLQEADAPAPACDPDSLSGEARRSLLARAKVLLSLQAETEPAFDWLLATQAICAGCLVVSEHSLGIEPLASGEHVITGGLDRLGQLCASAVDDASARERIRRAAYQLLVEQRPMAAAATTLARAASRIDARPPATTNLRHARIDFLGARRRTPDPPDRQPPASDYSQADGVTHRALKAQTLASLTLRRRLERLELSLAGIGQTDLAPEVIHESRGWSTRPPREVSVIVPLYNHAGHVQDALASVIRSDRPVWELIVVDDASTDGGGEVVSAVMEAHGGDAAWRLVRQPVNRGLALARNCGAEYASAARLLMLDADNELRPTAIGRLLDAMRDDPTASFAYGIIEQFSADGPHGLTSPFPWSPERLRGGNYIDALAMINRDVFEPLGGYSDDPRLALGWEDYDLWARMAESGRHAAFVPEMIARYRVGHSSMVSMTNISRTDAHAAVADHAPKLMRNLHIPH